LGPASALPLLPFCLKRFLLASYSFQAKEKKKTIEEKKCREGKELSFKLPLYPFTFGSYFYPPISPLLFQTFSLGTFFFSSIRK